jgi:hypothetical protein
LRWERNEADLIAWDSAHNPFSPIHYVLDTNDLIAELLEMHTPPGKPN